jgi:hypothetical protein
MGTLSDAVARYQPKDDFFGRPYVDVDEERADPLPHRYVHGGFEGTATLFSFYFPPECADRFFHFLEGAYGGNERASKEPLYASAPLGALGFAASRGAFLVESNQGHVGAEICPKAGSDSSIYTFRASAESARLARVLAETVYGKTPAHGYVYGASGGGSRTQLCCELVEDDVWDAGVAAVAGGATAIRNYSVMNNAKRLLGKSAARVADSTDVGGSGNPFDGLTTEQRGVLADLYAAGFPRGAERSLAGSLDLGFALWAWQGDHLVTRHPDYFDAFWSEPGHAGADGELDGARITLKTTVSATVNKTEAAAYSLSPIGFLMLVFVDDDKRVGLVLHEDAPPLVEGSTITIMTGAAAGRRLYCTASGGPLLIGTSLGEAQELLFDGVQPGDEVVIDNRDYLAYCYYYRHHVAGPREIPRFSVDDHVVFPTYEFDDVQAYGPPMAGMGTSGAIRRPLIQIQHALDTSCWLIDGVRYDQAVRSHLGDSAAGRWRLWLMENAEHVPGSAIIPGPPPVPSSRLIEGFGALEAGVDAMVAWIEEGEIPSGDTVYDFDSVHNRVTLVSTPAARHGIQPTVTASADGGERAQVRAGDEVTLAANAAVPDGVGAIVEMAWDFDGSGEWTVQPFERGPAPSVSRRVAHRYEVPGEYFPSCRVISHAFGDSFDPYARIMNFGRCRVVVS